MTQELKEKTLPALLLHQETRHRPGTGHRQPHHRRPSRIHSRRGKQAGRRPVRSGVAGRRGIHARAPDPPACITFSSWTTNPASANPSTACWKMKATRLPWPTAARPAWTPCASARFDVVLLDVWLPGMDGLEALQKIHDIENAPEVIMISGHGTIETAVRATKLGALRLPRKATLHRQDAHPDQETPSMPRQTEAGKS